MNEKNKHIVDFEFLSKYLAQELDADQQLAVDAWLSERPANRQEFEELEKVWDAADKVKNLPTIDIDSEWEVQLAKINKVELISKSAKTRKIKLKTVLQIAASIALLMALIVGGDNILTSSYKTQLTETNKIELPDGSVVTLNGNSKISYTRNYGKKNRSLKLSGEAFFEVQADKDKPFIVETGKASVKVLGTSFNVKAYKNLANIEVTVAEGSVSLYDTKRMEKQIILKSGESASYLKQKAVIEKQLTTNRNYQAWKTRVLYFDNSSLEDVFRELENVYKLTFSFGNPMLKHCSITVVFDNQELESVVKILESTLDLKAEISQEKVVFHGASCQ